MTPRLSALIAAGDTQALLAYLDYDGSEIPIGCWHSLPRPDGLSEADHDTLDRAIALEAAILGLPTGARQTPLAALLANPNPTDFPFWLQLVEHCLLRRSLLGLLAQYVLKIFPGLDPSCFRVRPGYTFVNQIRPPEQSVIDWILSPPPGGWIEARQGVEKDLPWTTTLHTEESFVHLSYHQKIEADTFGALVLPDAITISSMGTIFCEAGHPSMIGKRELPKDFTPSFILEVISQHLWNAKLDYSSENLIFIHDSFASSYYHCFFDFIPRLRFCQHLIDEFGFQIAVPADGQRIFAPILHFLGYGESLYALPLSRMQHRLAYIANADHPGRFPSPQSVEWVRDRVRERLRAGPPRRLYISRVDAGRRLVLNDAEIFDTLKPYGFERVIPGQLPIEQQLNLFASAEVVIGPHGGAFTNLVACRHGTTIIEFIADSNQGGWFSYLSHVLGLNHHLMLAHAVDGNLMINPRLLVATLEQVGVSPA